MAKQSASQTSMKSGRYVIGGIAGVLLLGLIVIIVSACKTRTNTESAGSAPNDEKKSESSQPKTFTEDLGKGVKLEMVEVPGGTFQMGSPNSEENRNANEGPQHRVTVASFAMGKYEVTQEQWRAVMSNDLNLSIFEGDDLPVAVAWSYAQEFCRKLSQRSGKKYRLPTEAEWEYACRAGTTGAYAGALNEMAWYTNNSGRETHPVGQKKPNAFGLYDMHGNMWEWCQDAWHDSYNGAPSDGSSWLSGGDSRRRVLRGGSWSCEDELCRSAQRFWILPGYPSFFGFRVAVART